MTRTNLTRLARLWPLVCAAAMGMTGAAYASNFEISPVVLELSSARTAGVVKIVNNDNHDVSLQLRAFEWTQSDNKDDLKATQNLIISPPVFNLAPGASQVVRIVSKQPSGDNEIAFRMLIDEIPSAVEGATVNFKFRISMPVFIAANGAPKFKLDYTLHAGKPAKLIVQNTGNRRGRLVDLAITLPNGKKVAAPGGGNPYTLAGVTRVYQIDTEAPLAAGSKVRMSATGDGGALETDLTVAP